MKTIRDWRSTFGTMIIGSILAFIVYNYMKENEVITQPIIICSLLSLICLFGAFNEKVILNFKDDYLSYFFFFIFRRKIKLSEIDSAEIERNIRSDVDSQGKLKTTNSYKVYLYGTFGERTINFYSRKPAMSLVSSIQNRR